MKTGIKGSKQQQFHCDGVIRGDWKAISKYGQVMRVDDRY